MALGAIWITSEDGEIVGVEDLLMQCADKDILSGPRSRSVNHQLAPTDAAVVGMAS